jgi:hypothetical protein
LRRRCRTLSCGAPPPGRQATRPVAAGPGEYHNSNSGGSTLGGPAFSIGGRPQRGASSSQAGGGPGPGAYEAPSSGQGGPAHSIGARWRDSAGGAAAAAAPGPGEYGSHAAAGRSVPAFTIGARRRPPDAASAAGTPGGRCPALQRGAAGHATGELPRPWLLPSTPTAPPLLLLRPPLLSGPGEYEGGRPAGPTGPAFSIGARHSRGSSRNMEASPGPGHFDSHAAWGGGGPAFTIGARRHSPDGPCAADAPGTWVGGPLVVVGVRWRRGGVLHSLLLQWALFAPCSIGLWGGALFVCMEEPKLPPAACRPRRV